MLAGILFLTLFNSFTLIFSNHCKFGVISGGYTDCACIEGRGIWTIIDGRSCSEDFIPLASKSYCYETRNIHKHILLTEEMRGPKEIIRDNNIFLIGEGSFKISLISRNLDVERETIGCTTLPTDTVCRMNLDVKDTLKQVDLVEGCKSLPRLNLDCKRFINMTRSCKKAKNVPHQAGKRHDDFQASGGHGNRVKRGVVDPAVDEDAYLVAQPEIGHELMRKQIARHIISTTAKLVGIAGSEGGQDVFNRRYPVFKLLDLAKVVMQKTCAPISPSFFSMATAAFMNLQMETLHLQEPYISYPAFVRMETALRKCIADAKPHVFHENKNGSVPIPDPVAATAAATASATATSPNGTANGTASVTLKPEYCNNDVPLSTTGQLETPKGVKNISLPSYASGISEKGALNEPLIETVWKIFVNAHSYCYTRFSDFYNDHHTFTVSFLPLFANDIQDIWLGKDSAGYDLTTGLLYGGLLGDVSKLMSDVNNCVGAARTEGVAYPWLLQRPPKENRIGNWRRKKRALEGDEEKSSYCLQTRRDVEAVEMC